MKTCPKCGKRIKSVYELCWACRQQELEKAEYRRWSEKTEDEKELEREIYYSTECDMCGKEGADPRSDGRNYCGSCWSIWNS